QLSVGGSEATIFTSLPLPSPERIFFGNTFDFWSSKIVLKSHTSQCELPLTSISLHRVFLLL
ncbi:hypothetical protein N312_01399, partial [Balearica regulorum gibbericeps]